MTLVRRYERLDYAAGSAKFEGGFLRVDGKLARTGVQEYRDSSGKIRREARFKEDVKASVPGFSLAPLTNTHPPKMVSPENASQFVVGAVGEAKFDGKWISAPLSVYTKDAIAAIQAGRAQLSVGYQCEVVDEQGEFEGEHYDSRQTNIQVNHVALVDAARAGPEARLRLDSGDATCGNFDTHVDVHETPGGTPQANTETKPMPMKVKLDGGFEVEVADANAVAAIERSIETARKAGEAAAATERARADSAEKAKAESDKKLVESQARVDHLEAQHKEHLDKMVKCDECAGSGKMDGESCKGCSGKGEMKVDEALKGRADSIARAVAKSAAKRAKLLVQVADHLSANENLDDLTEVDIKRKVLAKLNVNLDGKDDAYVLARYDVAMEGKPTPLEQVRAGSDPTKTAPRNDGPSAGPDDARARMMKRNAEVSAAR